MPGSGQKKHLPELAQRQEQGLAQLPELRSEQGKEQVQHLEQGAGTGTGPGICSSSWTEKNQLPELTQHQEQRLAQLPELGLEQG